MLSHREEQILLLLKKFDFLTRDQLNRYFKFGSIRNTNMILSRLSDYLKSYREGYQSIYYLNRQGRKYVDCEKIRKKGGHVQHIVMRNDFWLFSGCPSDWKNEMKISDGRTTVVADSLFTQNHRRHFLEVDNKQTMNENRNKIKRYKALYSVLETGLGHSPTLVWLTTTEHRKSQLKKACEDLLVRVYSIEDIK